MTESAGTERSNRAEKESQMPTLDELMSLPGVYGAIEFSCTGSWAKCSRSERDFAELVAQNVCRQHGDLTDAGDGMDEIDGAQGFLPERGFAFVSLDRVVMGMNGNAVLRTARISITTRLTASQRRRLSPAAAKGELHHAGFGEPDGAQGRRCRAAFP